MRLKDVAKVSLICAATIIRADPSAAAEETGGSLFKEALLGHCYLAVTGNTFMKTTINVSSWKQVVSSEGKGPGGLTANARVKATPSGDVIVDRTRDGCFVQAINVDSASVSEIVRAALQEPPFGAVLYDDKTREAPGAPRRRSTVFFVVSSPGDTAPMIVVNEFFPPAPGVVTGHVALGRKAPAKSP